MKLTRSQIMDIHATLVSPQIRDGNFRRALAFGLARLATTLEPIVKAMREAATPAPRVQEFHRLRIELLRKHARKNPDGQPVTRPAGAGAMQFDIAPESQVELDSAIQALRADFKDDLEKDEGRTKEVEELGAQVEEVQAVLPLSLFPETLPMQVIAVLYPLIEDDTEGGGKAPAPAKPDAPRR